MLFKVKTATIEELRADPDCLERWISEGEEVRIVKNGTPFANVVPFPPENEQWEVSGRAVEWPDFAARAKRILELNEGQAVNVDIERLRDEDERSFGES